MNKIIILSQTAALLSCTMAAVRTKHMMLLVPIVFTAVSIALNVIVCRMEKKGA